MKTYGSSVGRQRKPMRLLPVLSCVVLSMGAGVVGHWHGERSQQSLPPHIARAILDGVDSDEVVDDIADRLLSALLVVESEIEQNTESIVRFIERHAPNMSPLTRDAIMRTIERALRSIEALRALDVGK